MLHANGSLLAACVGVIVLDTCIASIEAWCRVLCVVFAVARSVTRRHQRVP